MSCLLTASREPVKAPAFPTLSLVIQRSAATKDLLFLEPALLSEFAQVILFVTEIVLSVLQNHLLVFVAQLAPELAGKPHP